MNFTVHDGSTNPTQALTPEAAAQAAQQVAWLTHRLREGADRQRYLLMLRFALVNIVGTGLLAVGWVSGYIGEVFRADKTQISAAICIVFVGGVILCGFKIYRVSRELDAIRNFNPLEPSLAANYLARLRGRGVETHSLVSGTMRLTLSQGISVVRHVAGSLVLLGLIGTVVGFIIALSGVDPDKASDFDSISPMVSQLIQGMSTALYTTLVGGVLNLWLMINYRMLASGTVKLITSLIEFGEANGRT